MIDPPSACVDFHIELILSVPSYCLISIVLAVLIGWTFYHF